MNRAEDICRGRARAGKRGAGRLNFLIVLAVVALAGYSAYQFAPVAYHASLFKVYMQDTVNRAAATGQSRDWLLTQLRGAAEEYAVPPDALIEATNRDGYLEAHVRWTRPVPLPGYVYQYNFDHTVRSSSFFQK